MSSEHCFQGLFLTKENYKNFLSEFRFRKTHGSMKQNDKFGITTRSHDDSETNWHLKRTPSYNHDLLLKPSHIRATSSSMQTRHALFHSCGPIRTFPFVVLIFKQMSLSENQVH